MEFYIYKCIHMKFQTLFQEKKAQKITKRKGKKDRILAWLWLPNTLLTPGNPE